MKLDIPELALVVLIGPSGSGKSSFAAKHFKRTEIVSSDFCRGVVSDDENDQSATGAAFELLHYIARRRLAGRRLTVVDATSVQPESRNPLVAIAREFHAVTVAIVFNLPEDLCFERNRDRPDRDFGPHVIRQQHNQLGRSLRGLQREGFRYVYVMTSPDQVDAASIERTRLWTDLRHERGPFDMIGDVHGCFDELQELLVNLGYRIQDSEGGKYAGEHPDGRRAIFLGDLVDRGPDTPGVLKLVMSMVASGAALCVPGNHDVKLMRKLRGRNVQITHGLAESLEQLEREPPEFKEEVAGFIDGLRSHYWLDDGRLVAAHAGMREDMRGRASRVVREFALFGETIGETDEFGLPVRYNWAQEYRGEAMVVYGHTPVVEPEWTNRTINIDTGCVFGGKLTALRYPEREFVSVPARKTYYEPARPFLPEGAAAPSSEWSHQRDELLDLKDVLGKRIVSTRLHHNVTVREENAAAALEVMSCFAADPRWLIYLPPTMSPTETSAEPGLLEHPAEAFAYFRRNGVASVICEQKHMGSRAIALVCRDPGVPASRFGIPSPVLGTIYTRTGRPFFDQQALEVLRRIRDAAEEAGIWDELNTDWICLDCELMPWSAKAQELIQHQYAQLGAAGRAALGEAAMALAQVGAGVPDIQDLSNRVSLRSESVQRYVEAYRQYCWPVESVDDLKLAPFHVLASENAVHISKDHPWHMDTIARIFAADPKLLLTTPYRVVDTTQIDSQDQATQWWESLTANGGEGMVVKPLEFVSKGQRGLVQPALKVRGREYLRIIYGPEYDLPHNLERLRSRGVSAKRSLAAREFALGIEALERFVRREPLYRVHECVFGVLALESEPVDPRL